MPEKQDFCIKLLKKDVNKDVLIQQIREFFNYDEPTLKSKLLRLDFEEFDHAQVDKDKLKALQDNLSLVAITPNGDTVGIMISGWIYKDDKFNESMYRHPQSRALAKLFHDTETEADLFNKFGVDKIIEIKVLGVHPKYRKMGVGKKLFEANQELARTAGSKVLQSGSTSAYSRKMMENLSWKLNSEVFYEDFLDENGKQIIQFEMPHDRYQFRYIAFD